MPELLTVFFSSLQGMFDTSIYNIISSNVINFTQYITSIVINKNGKVLRNRALKVELGIVVFTILIPLAMITGLKLLAVGIVLFFVGNLLRKYIRSIKYKF